MKQPSIADTFSKAKPSSISGPSFNSSDSEAEAKVVAKKAKPVSKRKQVDSDDSDSDSGDLMSRLKAKAVGNKASVIAGFPSEVCVKQLTLSLCPSRNPRSTSMMKPSTFPTRKHPSRWRSATTPHVHGNQSPISWTPTQTPTFR